MKLKVCGMKHPDNIKQVAALQPDYLGFIFYKNTPRFFDDIIPKIPETIKKVGVFVNASKTYILEKIETHKLDYIQLHGDESPEFCKDLIRIITDSASRYPKIIKVFSIKDKFDFQVLKPYEPFVDYFLFDTKGKQPGGNGYTFNWNILTKYPSTKPYFLSGGIGLNEIKNLKQFFKNPASKNCFAIDVNSQFEIEPGLKNINKLQQFKNEL